MMFLLIHVAFMLLLKPIFVFAGVISTPSINIGSFNISTPQETDQCKWSIFVRADDLRIGDLAYGEARLINNLTNINNTQNCEIVRWSLILRSSENAAMRYPMPLIELPKEPTYNHTWDRYRYRANDILNDKSSLNDESGLFIFDPYKEEREEYDRKLEEYAKAIRTKDHFIVQKIEKTHFEIQLDMGEVEESVEDYQMTPLEPFAVSLPSSMKGPYIFQVNQRTYFNDRSIDRMANITYRQDSQLTYLAKIELRNGTEVELQAGDASFIPSKPEMSVSLPNQIKVDEKKGKSWPANQIRRTRRIIEDEEDKDTIMFSGLNATINFDQIPQLKQGDNILLNGKVTSTNSSYEIVSIAIRLDNRVEPKWALDKLMSDKRPELYEELKKKSDYPNDDGSRWFFNDDRTTVSVTVPQTAVSTFEKEKLRIVNKEHDPRCDTSCRYSCTGMMGFDAKRTSSIDDDGSFSIWLNISDIAAISPMDTSISHITSRLSFVFGLRLIEKKEEEEEEKEVSRQGSSVRVQAIREAMGDWPDQAYTMFFRKCPEDSDKGRKKKEKESATFFLKQPIGEVSIFPKQWQKYDLNAQERNGECISTILQSGELGPKLIRLNNKDDEKEHELHSQQACESKLSAFPKLSNLSKTILKSSAPGEDAKIEKINSLEFRNYKPNRFESCHMNFFIGTRQIISPSTCSFNTGQVWAKKLLDRFKLRHSSEQQTEYSVNQDKSLPVLQFQETNFNPF